MGASTWLEPATSWLASPGRTQLAITAITSGALVAVSILAIQTLRRDQQLSDLKSSIPPAAQQDPVANKISQYGDPKRPHLVSATTTFGSSSINTSTSTEDARGAARAERARQGDYSEDLILEQLARNRVFLQDAGLASLRSAFVIIVGLGGVGSHAAAALARSGVGRIRLIDFDQVTLSSLNRHALATLADVGTPKVHCVRRRLEQIAPWVSFDCRNELFGEASAASQLSAWRSEEKEADPNAQQQPDYIIDAIDNIDSKVALLAYCATHNLRVISSMGAACKSDPTRVFVGDISTTTEDPLSRATRRRLRARPHNIASGIACVFSTEKPGPGKAALLPLPDAEFERGPVADLGVLPDFRVRILPVLGTMPAVFGLCAANHVMLHLAGYPVETSLVKARAKLYEALLAGLQGMEERLARASASTSTSAIVGGGESTGKDNAVLGLRLPLTLDDVAYLLEEVYRGKSVVSGLGTRLALVRWTLRTDDDDDEHSLRRSLSSTDAGAWSVPGQNVAALRLDQLVVMTKDEAAVHEREVLRGGKEPAGVWGDDVVRRVRGRMDEEAAFGLFR